MTQPMTAAPLVVTTREDVERLAPLEAPVDPRTVENVHYGSIVVTDVDGTVIHRVGDPDRPVFTRSALKPFQALPFVREGGHQRFGWTSRHVALLCASHSGESMHTEVVSEMLASTDCDAQQLQCGCHVPGWYAATGTTPPADATWSPVEHNCSGKHAGFLAACRLHGESVDDYLAPASPLQRRVAAAIAAQADLAVDAMPSGTDGCSAPNFALSLTSLAGLYAQLAQGRAARREGDGLGTLFDAMTGHPELVSGTARSDRALMSTAPGDWVTKIGADGVQAIGIRSAGIGIALKVGDGSRDALYTAVVETLAQLGLVSRSAEVRARFAPWLRSTVKNARGRDVGRVRPVFDLQAAR